jgi:hypothetical protein
MHCIGMQKIHFLIQPDDEIALLAEINKKPATYRRFFLYCGDLDISSHICVGKLCN